MSVHTSPLEQPGAGDSGGMNVTVRALARQLAAAGIEVEIFTRAAGSDLPPTVAMPEGPRVHHLPAGPAAAGKDELASHLCAFYLALAGHPALERLELLHAHYWMSGWVGRLASRRLGLPLVQSFHTLARAKRHALAGVNASEPVLRATAERRIAASATAVVVPTATEARLLTEQYGAPAERVHVVPHGVDLEVFSAEGDRRSVRDQLGDGRIVLFAGRLQALKGPEMAVRTLAAVDGHLPADGLPARLVIVGGASGERSQRSDPDALRRLADELGVGDRVAILAPRAQEELAALYRAADAVLVPSRSESFGLVALEAQACGTPVVASAVGGLAHVVEDGAGGRLVDADDPEAFAAALAPYLTDPQARDLAGEAGRVRAREYGWQATAEATVAVYRWALAASATDRRAGPAPAEPELAAGQRGA